jgi:hypothetical protein
LKKKYTNAGTHRVYLFRNQTERAEPIADKAAQSLAVRITGEVVPWETLDRPSAAPQFHVLYVLQLMQFADERDQPPGAAIPVSKLRSSAEPD